MDFRLARLVGNIVQLTSGIDVVQVRSRRSSLVLSAITIMPASSPPAPPSKCPVMDLVELTRSLWLVACSPNSRWIAFDSVTSPSGVDVACAFTYSISWWRKIFALFMRIFHRPETAVAILRHAGDMVRIRAHPVADNLGQDLRPARLCMLQLFQNQNARAFAHNKAVAVA